MPHTLVIHYPVNLPCNLLILSRVHKNYVITDFEGWIKRNSVRSRQFPFPSMEADGRKSLCIAARDNILFYRESLRTGRRCCTNGIYLLMTYVPTDEFCMKLMLIRQGPSNFYAPTRIMY